MTEGHGKKVNENPYFPNWAKSIRPISRKEGQREMRKTWGEMAKLVMALTCAGIFWLQGPELFWLQDASAQGTFQAYTKPQGAPDFSLEDLQGKRVDIRDHQGQVILINFWASW